MSGSITVREGIDLDGLGVQAGHLLKRWREAAQGLGQVLVSGPVRSPAHRRLDAGTSTSSFFGDYLLRTGRRSGPLAARGARSARSMTRPRPRR